MGTDAHLIQGKSVEGESELKVGLGPRGRDVSEKLVAALEGGLKGRGEGTWGCKGNSEIGNRTDIIEEFITYVQVAQVGFPESSGLLEP